MTQNLTVAQLETLSYKIEHMLIQKDMTPTPIFKELSKNNLEDEVIFEAFNLAIMRINKNKRLKAFGFLAGGLLVFIIGILLLKFKGTVRFKLGAIISGITMMVYSYHFFNEKLELLEAKKWLTKKP